MKMGHDYKIFNKNKVLICSNERIIILDDGNSFLLHITYQHRNECDGNNNRENHSRSTAVFLFGILGMGAGAL